MMIIPCSIVERCEGTIVYHSIAAVVHETFATGQYQTGVRSIVKEKSICLKVASKLYRKQVVTQAVSLHNDVDDRRTRGTQPQASQEK